MTGGREALNNYDGVNSLRCPAPYPVHQVKTWMGWNTAGIVFPIPSARCLIVYVGPLTSDDLLGGEKNCDVHLLFCRGGERISREFLRHRPYRLLSAVLNRARKELSTRQMNVAGVARPGAEPAFKGGVDPHEGPA